MPGDEFAVDQVQAQGELRGARSQVGQALQQRPQNPLMWSLRAQVDEQLGEHQAALEAHARVHALVPESLEPILGTVLRLSDGRIQTLTWWERMLVTLRLTDAKALEARYARPVSA